MSPDAESEKEPKKKKIIRASGLTTILPICPMDAVLFPQEHSTFFAPQDAAFLAGIYTAYETNGLIGFVLLKEKATEETFPPIYQIGTVAKIEFLNKFPDGHVLVNIVGRQRFRIIQFLQSEPFIIAEIETIQEQKEIPEEILKKIDTSGNGEEELSVPSENKEEKTQRILQAAANTVKSSIEKIANLLIEIGQPPEKVEFELYIKEVLQLRDPARVADMALTPKWFKQITEEHKQDVLETINVYERLTKVYNYLEMEISDLEVRKDIDLRTERFTREFYLQQQLEAIKKELGMEDEATKYRRKIATLGLPAEVEKEALKTVEELAFTPPSSPQYSHLIKWLDLVTDLPWNRSTEDNKDIHKAEQILNEDHYGLQKIKERILEFLVIKQKKQNGHSPILCFLGPPGTGKTSIGRSIARAMDRKFIRISAGGKNDEAYIRGHSRTYVDASPGIIIQELKRIGVNNPVFMIDEIDKIGSSAIRGNPAAALLETLDPTQNYAFVDSYLNLPFDLSHVLFICTGNIEKDIPNALRDRMEILYFPGYTKEEKLQIAKNYLVPRQLNESGLTSEEVSLSDKAILHIISCYTREAGVRRLEQLIGNICRKAAVQIEKGKAKKITVGKGLVPKFLGAERYRMSLKENALPIGVSVGVAVTPYGGIPLNIEAEIIEIPEKSLMPHVKDLQITGNVQDIMYESALVARTFVAANLKKLGIPETKSPLGNYLHFHIPEGATPKDGPSAGIAFVVALISYLQQKPARSDVVMTGEITLHGKVLAVGGIKEKILAAKEYGAKVILIPKENEKDVLELPRSIKEALYRKEIEIKFISNVLDAVSIAIFRTNPPKKALS